MTEPSRGVGPTGAGRVRPDRVYLGWQYALLNADPGPQPRRPVPPESEQLNPGWVTAQRREEDRLNRPLKLAAVAALDVRALDAQTGAVVASTQKQEKGFGKTPQAAQDDAASKAGLGAGNDLAAALVAKENAGL